MAEPCVWERPKNYSGQLLISGCEKTITPEIANEANYCPYCGRIVEKSEVKP